MNALQTFEGVAQVGEALFAAWNDVKAGKPVTIGQGVVPAVEFGLSGKKFSAQSTFVFTPIASAPATSAHLASSSTPPVSAFEKYGAIASELYGDWQSALAGNPITIGSDVLPGMNLELGGVNFAVAESIEVQAVGELAATSAPPVGSEATAAQNAAKSSAIDVPA